MIATKVIRQKEMVNKFLNFADGSICKIIEKGFSARCTIEDIDPRTEAQNAKEHAMMTDLWKQAVYKIPGLSFKLSDYTFDEAKTLLVMWFANEMTGCGTPLSKPPKRVTDPISGEQYTIRPSTKDDMSMEETAQFIEWMYATGAQLRIRWSEPALQNIDYPEAQQ